MEYVAADLTIVVEIQWDDGKEFRYFVKDETITIGSHPDDTIVIINNVHGDFSGTITAKRNFHFRLDPFNECHTMGRYTDFKVLIDDDSTDED